MKSQLSRAGGALAALAVGAGLALTPTVAQAATSPQAGSAADWLAGELPDDGIVRITSDFGDGPVESLDHGLTLDFALTFLGTGSEVSSVDQVLDGLVAEKSVFTSYITGDDFVQFGEQEGSRYAGATSKLATTVQLAGRNAADFDGQDLIAGVEQVVVDDGASAGRASDISAYGDFSNAIGQSFAVRALTTADSSEAAAATDYLVTQQCDNGAFLLALSDAGCGAGGDGASIDTTAFAVQALSEAQAAGYAGADAVIADAVDFLVATQADDGSFSDEGKPNSNSTGLAATALSIGGEDAAATEAADYVADLQVGDGENAGAIAFDQAAFDAGTDGQLGDQFRRTTAQAALGLAFASAPEPEPEVGPVATMSLDISIDDPTEGDTITVTAAGEDAEGNPTGDVSDEITLDSSVATDTVDGNTVTFNTASPHTITATHTPTGTVASVTVQVTPLAEGGGTDAGDGEGGVDGGWSTVGAAGSGDSLPDAGTDVAFWQLMVATAMVAAGGVLLTTRRLLSRS